MNRDRRYLLLVDDEENILKALKREFADWAYEHGIEIITLNLAQTALDTLAEKGDKTVIVVSDLKMPGMKGSDFLLAVKEKWPHIVTILLTGFSETAEIIKAVRAGIFSYILKPWDSDYLIQEIGKALEHADLRQAHEEHLKSLESQLRLAGELQKTILKPSVPASDKVEFRVTYRPVPTLHCGGDYYDVIPLGSDRYFILLGHISAQGVRAAMITAMLKAIIFPEYIRNSIASQISPADFLNWLNQRMNFELRQTSGIAITFIAGYLDTKTPFFQYANAGAPHPIILRGDKAAELPVAGKPFSVSNSILYQNKQLVLQPRDTLTFFTDGLLGAAAPPGEDEEAYSGQTAAAQPVLTKAADIFTGVPMGASYHRLILDKALALQQRSDFTDHLTILTLRLC